MFVLSVERLITWIFISLHAFVLSVERYDYIVNGTALSKIKEYMKEEHTFAEFTVVGL